jgi:trimeric autotransporter adhesin
MQALLNSSSSNSASNIELMLMRRRREASSQAMMQQQTSSTPSPALQQQQQQQQQLPVKPPPPTMPKPKFILPQSSATNLVLQRNLKSKSELNIATPSLFTMSASSSSSASSGCSSSGSSTSPMLNKNSTSKSSATCFSEGENAAANSGKVASISKLPVANTSSISTDNAQKSTSDMHSSKSAQPLSTVQQIKNKLLENSSLLSSSQGYHSDTWDSHSSRQSFDMDGSVSTSGNSSSSNVNTNVNGVGAPVQAAVRVKHQNRMASKLAIESRLAKNILANKMNKTKQTNIQPSSNCVMMVSCNGVDVTNCANSDGSINGSGDDTDSMPISDLNEKSDQHMQSSSQSPTFYNKSISIEKPIGPSSTSSTASTSSQNSSSSNVCNSSGSTSSTTSSNSSAAAMSGVTTISSSSVHSFSTAISNALPQPTLSSTVNTPLNNSTLPSGSVGSDGNGKKLSNIMNGPIELPIYYQTANDESVKQNNSANASSSSNNETPKSKQQPQQLSEETKQTPPRTPNYTSFSKLQQMSMNGSPSSILNNSSNNKNTNNNNNNNPNTSINSSTNSNSSSSNLGGNWQSMGANNLNNSNLSIKNYSSYSELYVK